VVKKLHFLVGFSILLVLATLQNGFAQNDRRVIQLSGVVLSGDTSGEMLFGVNIYVPKAGRGTNTNSLGFFSMPVLAGDSIIISYVGFERQYFKVPLDANEYLTIIVQMIPDVTYLKEIEILPFPTEEIFKEAVLALNLPKDAYSMDRNNLNQALLNLMMRSSTPTMDGPSNQRFYLNQMAMAQGTQYAPIQNPLFNPFNWSLFFRSLNQGKR
jgi:hypothetical protein